MQVPRRRARRLRRPAGGAPPPPLADALAHSAGDNHRGGLGSYGSPRRERLRRPDLTRFAGALMQKIVQTRVSESPRRALRLRQLPTKRLRRPDLKRPPGALARERRGTVTTSAAPVLARRLRRRPKDTASAPGSPTGEPTSRRGKLMSSLAGTGPEARLLLRSHRRLGTTPPPKKRMHTSLHPDAPCAKTRKNSKIRYSRSPAAPGLGGSSCRGVAGASSVPRRALQTPLWPPRRGAKLLQHKTKMNQNGSGRPPGRALRARAGGDEMS